MIINPTEWARLQGSRPQTAYRWPREDRLPVPAVRVQARTVLIGPGTPLTLTVPGIGVYPLVSSHGRKGDLGPTGRPAGRVGAPGRRYRRPR